MIKKEKITTNMVNHSLSKAEDHKEVVVVANSSISILISEMPTISLKNFSEVKILLLTFSTMTTISSQGVSDMVLVEEWWGDMDSLVDLEGDSAGEWWIKIINKNNKKNKEETEIRLQTSEWWDLDLMMMMTFLEVASEEDLEEVSVKEEDSDKGDSNHSNLAVLEVWEAEWESL